MTRLRYHCIQAVQALVKQIINLPGGTLWWYGLPIRGKHNRHVTLRKWSHLLECRLFPPEFRQILLLTALTAEGRPDARGLALYRWLLRYWYSGKPASLYGDWLQYRTQGEHCGTLSLSDDVVQTAQQERRRHAPVPRKPRTYDYTTYPPRRIAPE